MFSAIRTIPADETLTGRTTRPVTFTDKSTAVVALPVRRPAGTLVYVTCPRPGTFRIRIPGTLLDQDVDPGARRARVTKEDHHGSYRYPARSRR